MKFWDRVFLDCKNELREWNFSKCNFELREWNLGDQGVNFDYTICKS